MTPDVLVSGLRWATWAFCYLATALAALFMFGAVAPLPRWGRWVALGVTFYLLGWDAKRKLKGDK